MVYLQNQPYPFVLDTTDCDCCDEDIIPQLVDQSDLTQFQNIIEVAGSSPQVVPDPTFALTIGGGSPWVIISPTWTVGGGQLCKALNGVSSASQAFQLGMFTIGSYYQVNVTVNSLSGGTFDLTVAGNLFTVNSAGSYQFNVQATADGFRVFGDDDVLGCLSLVEAFETFPQHTKWLIKDSTDMVVAVLDQENNPDAFEITGKHITGFIDWEQLALDDGCYTIGVADPNINTCGQNFIFNGEFVISGVSGDQGTTGWTLIDGLLGNGIWQIIAGSLEYNSSGAADVGTAISSVSLCQLVYDVEISISSITDTAISLSLGTTTGAVITTTGVHNQSILSNGTDLSITASPTAIGVTSVSIDYIKVSINTRDYTPNECGPVIALGTHDCTHLLNACHNSNVGGFNFEGSFSPHVRLNSAIGRAGYGGDRVATKLSSGFKENIYFNRDKVKELQISTTSSYIHDFLSLLRGFKYFGVDGIRHHVEDDEYQPVYADIENCNAQSIIQISKSPQPNDPNIVFRDCTGVATNCGGSFLLQENETENFITLQDGGLIIID